MKIVCIYHNQDLDGWMSAAIVKHWFLTDNKRDYYIYDFHNYEKPSDEVNELCFLGWNYGDPIPDLSEYDKVIMCDISFPRIEMHKLASEKDFTWIDHHISAITENIAFDKQCYEEKYKGIRGINFAACELTWRYFFHSKPMPEIVRLLGLYDNFRHKNTDEEQYVLHVQYGARSVISNYEQAYEWLQYALKDEFLSTYEGKAIHQQLESRGLHIYDYLCSEAKQIYKSRFRIVFEEYREDLKLNPFNPEQGSTMQYEFICINKERFNPINFGIDYHQEVYGGCACFWYNGSEWCFSLYNENGKVDCSKLAAQFGGGGHAGAAGFRVKDINKFLEEHKINKEQL